MVQLLSDDMKELDKIKSHRDRNIAVSLAASGLGGYSLGTLVARRQPFPSHRKFAIARVGLISILSLVRPRQSSFNRGENLHIPVSAGLTF